MNKQHWSKLTDCTLRACNHDNLLQTRFVNFKMNLFQGALVVVTVMAILCTCLKLSLVDWSRIIFVITPEGMLPVCYVFPQCWEFMEIDGPIAISIKHSYDWKQITVSTCNFLAPNCWKVGPLAAVQEEVPLHPSTGRFGERADKGDLKCKDHVADFFSKYCWQSGLTFCHWKATWDLKIQTAMALSFLWRAPSLNSKHTNPDKDEFTASW